MARRQQLSCGYSSSWVHLACWDGRDGGFCVFLVPLGFLAGLASPPRLARCGACIALPFTASSAHGWSDWTNACPPRRLSSRYDDVLSPKVQMQIRERKKRSVRRGCKYFFYLLSGESRFVEGLMPWEYRLSRWLARKLDIAEELRKTIQID